jgi:hypothetical protein
VQTKRYIIQGKPTGGLKSILPRGAEEGEVGVHKLREEEEKNTKSVSWFFVVLSGLVEGQNPQKKGWKRTFC